MNKTYTLKELADIGARKAYYHVSGTRMSLLNDEGENHQNAREAFTKAILDAIGYEFPKDEERDAFERWIAEQGDGFHPCGDEDKAFLVWKAGREELRREQMTAKEPPELVEKPLPAYGEVKTEPAWIPWRGGQCPLPDTVKRWEFRYRGGFISTDPMMPSKYHWGHDGSKYDIIAYRVWE